MRESRRWGAAPSALAEGAARGDAETGGTEKHAKKNMTVSGPEAPLM